MSVNTKHILIIKCLKLIEDKLQWGPAKNWHNDVFIELSTKISEETTVLLSSTTLKRVWGRVKYNSAPSISTLNTLAQFAGFDNWRDFKNNNGKLKKVSWFQKNVKLNSLIIIIMSTVLAFGFITNYTGNSVPLHGYDASNAYEGYSLVWSDEFEGSNLNNKSWQLELGNYDSFGNIGWGNNELQFYKTDNVTVENGYLVIEARQEHDGAYSSGRITTRGKKEFKYARVDVRAALPNQRGMCPAIWMLGENYLEDGWPICGEIDIAESFIYTPETTNRIKSNVSWGKTFPALNRKSSDFVLSSGNFSDEWHVFSLLWDENVLKFLVDGIQYHELVINEELGQYFRKEFYFILNLSVGGNPVQNPDKTTHFPQRMFVDYIRVYQKS